MAKKTEISVREAARQINCTERTIINFIKMKRFTATTIANEISPLIRSGKVDEDCFVLNHKIRPLDETIVHCSLF